MQPAVFIQGRKVTLGPVDPADAEQYSVWVNDPRVRVYLNGRFRRPSTRSGSASEGLIGPPTPWASRYGMREDGRLIADRRSAHPRGQPQRVFTIFLGRSRHLVPAASGRRRTRADDGLRPSTC